eukprot:2274577-Amphidinium_carterae.1
MPQRMQPECCVPKAQKSLQSIDPLSSGVVAQMPLHTNLQFIHGRSARTIMRMGSCYDYRS